MQSNLDANFLEEIVTSQAVLDHLEYTTVHYNELQCRYSDSF